MLPEFAEWETFYVIVGASAGALIGLQFVVLTLIAEGPSIPGAGIRRWGISAQLSLKERLG